jgi:hypothetical protein
MLNSMQRLPRLALPILSAMLFLSSDPSTAQAPGPTASKHAPGQVEQRITPEAAPISTAHYQAALTLTCNGGQLCRGDFPAVAARRKLNVTRMTCLMRGANYSSYASGKIELQAADGSISLASFLPADHSTEWGYHLLNHAVDVRIAARQRTSVSLFLAHGSGIAYDAACTAHGTLETY